MAGTPAGKARIALMIGMTAALGAGLGYAIVIAPRGDDPPPAAVALGAEDPAQDSLTWAVPGHDPGAVAPRLDVVRVTPDGAGLLAGRAEPGARVTVRAGGVVVAETEAGATGEFVTSFQVVPAGEPRALVLDAEVGGRVTVSEETVLLLPPVPASDEPQVAALPPEADPEEAAAAAPERTEVDAAADDTPEDSVEDAAGFVAATAVLRPAEVTEVVATEAAATGAGLRLASIDYGATGHVTLAGYAEPGSVVRIYLDGAHALDAEADGGGRWEAELDDVTEGVHRLRVDALHEDGTVAGRVETPFQRDFPEADADPRAVTVQPGNSLWTIAQNRYGSGVHYTKIFTANADLIRNPDLIYPGQIFVLPEAEADDDEAPPP